MALFEVLLHDTHIQAAPLVAEAGRQLSEILQVYEASLIPVDGLGYALDEVLTALIEPILRACRLGAEGIDPSDAAVFMLNNATALQVKKLLNPPIYSPSSKDQSAHVLCSIHIYYSQI